MIRKQDFEQFMTQARIKLVGASDAGIKAELYDVLSEFFTNSSCWTETITVAVKEGTSEFSVPSGEGQILRLVGVVDANNLPVAALMPHVGKVTLQYPTTKDQDLTLMVVKNVDLPTDKNAMPVAPDWVFPRYHVEILDGLLGKMMTSPNKSYSNDSTGVYHLRRFRDGMVRARVAKLRENSFGSQAWRYPQNFRVDTQKSGVPSWGNGRSF